MVRGEEVGHFCEVAGMSIVAAGGLHSAVHTINCRQPSGLNFNLEMILMVVCATVIIRTQKMQVNSPVVQQKFGSPGK